MSLTVAVISPSPELAEAVKPLLHPGDRLSLLSSYRCEEVSTLSPDLVVIDMTSPPLRALELLGRLERLPATRKVAVIAVSDLPELEFEVTKVLDFLLYPADPARLRHGIDLLRKGGRRPDRKPSLGALSDNDHRLFHDYFVMTTGLHFDKRNMRILERGLSQRMTALRVGSYEEYYHYLLKYQDSRNELKKLLPLLTVGETFFFRYHGHFEALTQIVVPRLRIEQGPKKKLAIWSAGCSTGEEPYSIAMTLLEEVPDFNAWQIRITATDINQRALSAAREGMYGERALRITPEKYIGKYFQREGRTHQISPRIRHMIDFQWLNLQAEFPWEKEGPVFDVIFCRNVMIYFSTTTFRKVVTRLAASLKPGGYLFLGHSESLYHVSEDFEPVRIGGSFFYRKKNGSPEASQTSAESGARRNTEFVYEAPAAPPAPEITATAEPRWVVAADVAAERNPEDVMTEAVSLFEAHDYSGSASLAADVLRREPHNAKALVLQGFILANQGQLDEALRLCRQALEEDDLLGEAYYLKGLVHDLNDQWKDAKSCYRKAILLQTDLVMAHYCLARLLFRHDKEKEGCRSLMCAQRELEKSRPQSQVKYSGGLVREEMLQFMKKEVGEKTIRNDRK